MTPYMFNLTNRLITKNLKIRLVKTLKLKMTLSIGFLKKLLMRSAQPMEKTITLLE